MNKEHSIHNFEDLMVLVNDENVDIIFANCHIVVTHFLELKKKHKSGKNTRKIELENGGVFEFTYDNLQLSK